ncbi:uncharacterized protein K452DRAFT_223126 [Aplosporella prunicola CBS 121167]|uniref:Metallo-beta-lactamase domain-containing protein n=1 Tax=Aplosporella prunicola CBS 121167 TaxID=1176127 RepID=A0A6A6BKF4_9PEZI|nr:uncharacterized protein K452DRAFT_223126 [Aplosporella prunicola CBS 121167]KAF2144602.1 hypothetical protein K452DRAFT_223126 [Aplosporella prunicola CBS 121167]
MLTIKALNADTSFLATFSPSCAPDAPSAAQFPGSFTVLIDPWLSGPSQILSPKFSISWHNTASCVSSLADLPEPDLIIISQDKPDHCHEATLRTLPSNARSIILAAPAAAKKIRKWNHFEHAENIHTMKPYSATDDTCLFRLEIPAFSSSGLSGEITVAYMPVKRDISGLHSAVGITYRAPSSVLSPVRHTYINLPPSPPESPFPPNQPQTPQIEGERTLSLLYSPHGVPYSVIAPYASSHLVSTGALPLTTLVHSFDRVDNPWYLGGNIAAGKPGGVEIASKLMARCWLSAHDEEKDNRGVSVRMLKVSKFNVEEVKKSLGNETRVARLGPGEEMKVDLDEGKK